MTKTSINMTSVKISNRAQILMRIGKEKLSRKELSDQIGLTPAAVTILVNEMIQEGVILETGESEIVKKKGRRQNFIKLNERYKHVIGVNIEPNEVCISLSNLYKEVIFREAIALRNHEPEFVIQLINDAINRILTNASISKDSILGIGVGVVGLVNSSLGISYKAYELWNSEVSLKELLEEKTHLEVVLDNNVRTLALAEVDKTKESDLVFVKYGPGIGASLVLNGQVYSGFRSNALEFGHTIVNINGDTCSCGQKGCLEVTSSPKAIINKISNLLIEDVSSIEDVIHLYKQQNKKVIKVIDEAMTYFALGLNNLMKICDTSRIVLYGTFFKEPTLLQLLNEKLCMFHPTLSENIEYSKLDDNKSIGGLTLAINKLFIEKGGK
jgi:predicted NBD/HSP70 family sugar kinase